MKRRCPDCGGDLFDEPGNDALVCTRCGNLYDLHAFDDDAMPQWQKEAVARTIETENKLRKFRIVQIIVTVLLCVGIAVISVLRFLDQMDVPDASVQTVSGQGLGEEGFELIDQLLEDYPSEEDKIILTEEIMKTDYEAYYAQRMNSDHTGATVGFLFGGIGAVFLISAVIGSIVRYRLTGEGVRKKEIAMRMACVITLAILFGVIYIYYLTNKIPEPKVASYSVSTMEITRKRSVGTSGKYAGAENFYIYFVVNGVEYSRQVEKTLYDCFPERGTYFLVTAMHNNISVDYKAYPATKYRLLKDK